MQANIRTSVILSLTIFCMTWSLTGCQHQAQQPTPEKPVAQQPVQGGPIAQQPQPATQQTAQEQPSTQQNMQSETNNDYQTACVMVAAAVYDQPGGKSIFEVFKGNAVTVLKNGNGWSQILMYVFEAGNPSEGWVPDNVLTKDASGLTEGRLNTDVTPIMTGPPSDGKPITAYGTSNVFEDKIGTPVIYHQKQNDWVDCSFPAVPDGGWIPIKDIDFIGPLAAF